MQEGKLNFLTDISFGSSGKGNIAAYLGSTYDYDLCVSNNAANAGHSIVWKGENEVVKVLPTSGIVNKNSNIIVGAGAAFNIDQFLLEVEKYGAVGRTLLSAYAPVINDYCREYEKEHLSYIASTFQGVGAALGLKAMRSPKIKLAKDYPELEKFVHHHIPDIIINRIRDCKYSGLCEISQGYGLSLDSDFYPYVTSRPINVGQALAYLDIPACVVGDRIGVARAYPIRVGNVPGGHSGTTFPDSEEVSWEWLSERIGRPVKELTSVTKRVRRVFKFSKMQFEQAVRRNDINILFLTFVDYLLSDERSAMIDYFTSSKFNFDEIYFVKGFWNWDENIERIK